MAVLVVLVRLVAQVVLCLKSARKWQLLRLTQHLPEALVVLVGWVVVAAAVVGMVHHRSVIGVKMAGAVKVVTVLRRGQID
jgi:hypothetical protein